MSGNEHEIYPMPMFPRLTVSDVAASTEWYEALGFDAIYSMPVMAHVRYRKYADVMLAADGMAGTDDADDEGGDDGRGDDGAASEEDADDAAAAKRTRGDGVSIYVTVQGESVDDVAERAREFGAEIAAGPENTPWNTREVTILDPDGYELVFSEEAESGKSFESVMGSAVEE